MIPDFLDLIAFSQLFVDQVRLGLLPKRFVDANGFVEAEIKTDGTSALFQKLNRLRFLIQSAGENQGE
jgi:hypothetical protein